MSISCRARTFLRPQPDPSREAFSMTTLDDKCSNGDSARQALYLPDDVAMVSSEAWDSVLFEKKR